LITDLKILRRKNQTEILEINHQINQNKQTNIQKNQGTVLLTWILEYHGHTWISVYLLELTKYSGDGTKVNSTPNGCHPPQFFLKTSFGVLGFFFIYS
jgi:hypothetical protein